jgi:hypothetical protein
MFKTVVCFCFISRERDKERERERERERGDTELYFLSNDIVKYMSIRSLIIYISFQSTQLKNKTILSHKLVKKYDFLHNSHSYKRYI